MSKIQIIHNDNLVELKTLPAKKFKLIYIDPPFNTGDVQTIHGNSYNDSFDNFYEFICPRLTEGYRVLDDNGSMFVHLDYREVHYVKIFLDQLFGRSSFINEIIWSYDYGARSTKKWSTKHDTILWYAKNPKQYTFNYEAIDRIPYLAPGLVGAEKAERGKTPTDVWWNTIVPTNGKERVGYPTQKPLGILKRIVEVHSNEGDECLDFFAGSGSFGEACKLLNRNVTLIDQNEQAIEIMNKRLL